MVALISIAENLESPSDSVSNYMIKNDMEKFGFTKIATFVAITELLRKRFIVDNEESDHYGNPYVAYRLKPQGVDWLIANQERFALREQKINNINDDEDQLPF